MIINLAKQSDEFTYHAFSNRKISFLLLDVGVVNLSAVSKPAIETALKGEYLGMATVLYKHQEWKGTVMTQ